MLTSDINTISTAAANKADVCSKQFGKYFIRSIMAGFYIVIAATISHVTAAVLYPTFPQFGKVMSSAVFGIAIALVVFIGGELFTGNNLTMAIGYYNSKCTFFDMWKVWIVNYIGNFLGTFGLSFLLVKSGASKALLSTYYESFIYGKLEITPAEMVLRGILCNFMVCLAVWSGTRMKTETGKLVIIFLVIMTFVITGLEHCIANMSFYTIGYFLLGDLDLMLILRSMLFVTLGNMLGGAVLLALPLYLMSWDK